VFAEGELAHVAWSQSSPIHWGLFQGTVPADAINRKEAAAIHMTIRWQASYSVSSVNGATWTGQVASITVTSTMEPSQSWVVPGKALPAVLSHEQLHFDLNEVYRRKLECLLLETSTYTGTSQQAIVDRLNGALQQTGTAVLQKLSDMQTVYDSQTSHGTSDPEQSRWQGLINSWLINPTYAP
jgi:hypothetical protein